MKELSFLSKELKNFFYEGAEKTSKEIGFIKRNRKITATAFLKAMIFGNIADVKISIDRIKQLLGEDKIKITKQGVDFRFSQVAVEFLKRMYDKAIEIFRLKLHLNCKILDQFNSVKLLDSSYINLPNSMQDRYKGYGSSYAGFESKTKSGIKLQLLFDYINQRISKIDLKEGIRSDQGYRDFLESIEVNDLFIADLGYFVPSSFEYINNKGAYFISRYKADTNIYDIEDTKKIDLVKTLKDKTYHEQEILLGKVNKIRLRIICSKLPEEKGRARRRKANRLAKSHNYKVSNKNKELLKWCIFITNIQEEKISGKQIIKLYKVRWQIELLFKLYKSHLGINELKAKKNSFRVLCELYSKLIIIVVFHGILSCVKLKSSEGEISIFKAALDFKSRAREFLQFIKSSVSKIRSFLKNLTYSWSQFLQKDRPRKKRPSTFYMLQSLSFIP